jgi:signal transduction histidine kinase
VPRSAAATSQVRGIAEEPIRGDARRALSHRTGLARHVAAGVCRHDYAAQVRGARTSRRPDVAVDTIQLIQQVARQPLREVRERVWDLREVGLETDDLFSALEQFARDRTAGTGIDVDVVLTGKRQRLSSSLENSPFRIGREAVTNSVKHADARRIEIHVDFGSEVLRLEVRVDGRGCTPNDSEEARRKGHLGLTGINERVARAGGRSETTARPGGGTTLAAELPLAGPNAEPTAGYATRNRFTRSEW